LGVRTPKTLRDHEAGEAAGIALESVQLARPTLDDVFLTLTGRSLREDSVGRQLPRQTLVEGIAVSIGLAVICLWLAGRTFVRENA